VISKPHQLRRFGVCSLTALVTGCVDQRVVGDTTIFSFELWVSCLLFVVGVGGLSAVAIYVPLKRLGKSILVAVAAFVFLLLAPCFLVDRVTVNSAQFTFRAGFWLWPNYHEVHFDDVQRIVLAKSKSNPNDRWIDCYLKSGKLVSVPIGDLIRGAPAKMIIDAALENGIPVTNHWEEE